MRASRLDCTPQLYLLIAQNKEIGEGFVGWQGEGSYMLGTGTSPALSRLACRQL